MFASFFGAIIGSVGGYQLLEHEANKDNTHMGMGYLFAFPVYVGSGAFCGMLVGGFIGFVLSEILGRRRR